MNEASTPAGEPSSAGSSVPTPEMASRFARRAEVWKLRTRTLQLPARPLVMGILNVTPDSFSDGGKYFDPAAAIAKAEDLIAAGADLLDIGGESTRPYAAAITAEEEISRVRPILSAIARQSNIPLSIDTTKSAVARLALDLGAEIINDVSGLEADPQMVRLAVESGAGVCAMHMQGTPQTMQDDPHYEDVVAEIFAYLAARRDALLAAGIEADRICLDPGIGFGKTHQHNLTLLAHCHRFHALGQPLLVGPSRKGFIGKVLADKNADRTAGTIGVACSLAAQGVQILRVHDVAQVQQALRLFEATGGITGEPGQVE